MSSVTDFPLTVADAVRRALPVVLAAVVALPDAAVVGVAPLLVALPYLEPPPVSWEPPQAASVSARARTIGAKKWRESFIDDLLLVADDDIVKRLV